MSRVVAFGVGGRVGGDRRSGNGTTTSTSTTGLLQERTCAKDVCKGSWEITTQGKMSATVGKAGSLF